MGEKLICPYPFSRTSVGHEMYVPCCGGWLTPEFKRLDHSGDVWNSVAAKELRKSIIDGNYKYCNREICKYPLSDINKVNEIDETEVFVSEHSVNKIKEGDYEYEYPVTSVVFEADMRCNLACPSCRKERIVSVSKEDEFKMFYLGMKIKKILSTIKKVKFGGYSEFFFSDHYMNLLKILKKKSAPNIQDLSILTNGTLLNEKMYNSLGDSNQLITEINISMDAGDEETYKVVRGGNWNNLMKNITFLKGLRDQGKLKTLSINFVVQEDNLDSIENFIKLGEKFQVDHIHFTNLLDWSMMKLNYKDKAVHLKTHEKHNEYLRLKEKALSHPLVRWPE